MTVDQHESTAIDMLADLVFARLRPRFLRMLEERDSKRAPKATDDPWLTVRQVAELTGKHPNTIRDALARGDLRGSRGKGGGGKGKGWRVRASAVARYMGG